MPTNENQKDTGVDEAIEAPETEAIATESVGEILRAERLRKELSEKEVADQLHITMHYVRAIESNSFEKLPGAVFVKGYIKSYALFLGLEESQVIGSYDIYVSEQQDAAREKTRIQVRRRKDKNRPWVIGSAIAFVSLFLILWFFNRGSEQAVESDIQEPSRSETRSEGNPLPESSAEEILVAMAEPVTSSGSEVLIQNEVGSLRTAEVAAQLEELADSIELGEGESSIVANPIGQAASLEQDEVQIALQSTLQSTPSSEILNPSDTIVSSTLAPSSESAVLIETVSLSESASLEGRVLIESEGSDLLLITLTGESWLEVSDGFDNLLYRDLTKAGDVLEIKGTSPFDILIGDAAVAKMTINGIDIDVSKNARTDNSARLTVGL